MPRWQRTIDVDAPASATWDLVGDPTSVPRWYPKYETADVTGGQRILRNADGGELVETLDDRDDDARRYSYTVVSGAPVSSYHASFEVQEREGGSRVVWTVEAEPKDPSVDLEARLVPSQEDALRRIKEIVEDGG
ncbi:MAG TPA: SRPBCC family protein [Miltoncostaeaceae bacterium]|nr:SRPBCC family protein [Miltoncostaeaceae bacterium]